MEKPPSSKTPEQKNNAEGPTKEEYLAHPRSREIREASIVALRLLNAHFAASKESEASTLTFLQQAKKNLEALGLRSRMHVGEQREFFQDPTHAAEFCGGQVLNVIDRLLTTARITTNEGLIESNEDIRRTTSEHGFGMIASDRVSEDETAFIALQGSANLAKIMLDAEEEVAGPIKETNEEMKN